MSEPTRGMSRDVGIAIGSIECASDYHDPVPSVTDTLHFLHLFFVASAKSPRQIGKFSSFLAMLARNY